MIAFSFLIVMVSQIVYDPSITNLINKINHDTNVGYLLIIGIYLIMLAIFIGAFVLFYRLIYGFLLRRLKKNYNELQKIDYN